MHRERRIWFAGGAIAGLMGVSGAAVLVWALFFHEDPVVLAAAFGLVLAFAQFVRRSKSVIAARIWSATSWLGLSGVGFWAFATYIGDRSLMLPPSQLQVIAFGIIWSSLAGMLAVGLFEMGRWLAGQGRDRREQPESS